MTQAIESVAAVRVAAVLFEDKRAEVQSDSCSEETFRQISAALVDAGYGGTVIAVDEL